MQAAIDIETKPVVLEDLSLDMKKMASADLQV